MLAPISSKIHAARQITYDSYTSPNLLQNGHKLVLAKSRIAYKSILHWMNFSI
jgi:hypothetical protein